MDITEKYQEIFNYFIQEHDVILLQSEMQEIISLVEKVNEKEDEWIKVSDRLPNEEERKNNWKFLVSNINDDWIDVAYYYPKSKYNKWDNGETIIIPTHWMPLPELPKE